MTAAGFDGGFSWERLPTELDRVSLRKAYARRAPVYDLVFGAVFERGGGGDRRERGATSQLAQLVRPRERRDQSVPRGTARRNATVSYRRPSQPISRTTDLRPSDRLPVHVRDRGAREARFDAVDTLTPLRRRQFDLGAFAARAADATEKLIV
jgi:hypothetical protein